MAVNASDECSAAFQLTHHAMRGGVMRGVSKTAAAVSGRNKVEEAGCISLPRLVEGHRGSLKGPTRHTRKAAADLG